MTQFPLPPGVGPLSPHRHAAVHDRRRGRRQASRGSQDKLTPCIAASRPHADIPTIISTRSPTFLCSTTRIWNRAVRQGDRLAAGPGGSGRRKSWKAWRYNDAKGETRLLSALLDAEGRRRPPNAIVGDLWECGPYRRKCAARAREAELNPLTPEPGALRLSPDLGLRPEFPPGVLGGGRRPCRAHLGNRPSGRIPEEGFGC